MAINECAMFLGSIKPRHYDIVFTNKTGEMAQKAIACAKLHQFLDDLAPKRIRMAVRGEGAVFACSVYDWASKAESSDLDGPARCEVFSLEPQMLVWSEDAKHPSHYRTWTALNKCSAPGSLGGPHKMTYRDYLNMQVFSGDVSAIKSGSYDNLLAKAHFLSPRLNFKVLTIVMHILGSPRWWAMMDNVTGGYKANMVLGITEEAWPTMPKNTAMRYKHAREAFNQALREGVSEDNSQAADVLESFGWARGAKVPPPQALELFVNYFMAAWLEWSEASLTSDKIDRQFLIPEHYMPKQYVAAYKERFSGYRNNKTPE